MSFVPVYGSEFKYDSNQLPNLGCILCYVKIPAKAGIYSSHRAAVSNARILIDLNISANDVRYFNMCINTLKIEYTARYQR